MEPKTLEERLATTERHATDAAEQVGVLLHDVKELLARVQALERKMRMLMPEVENCPKCHRKINPGGRSCNVCGHKW